jgi:hypothetical protein
MIAYDLGRQEVSCRWVLEVIDYMIRQDGGAS